MNFRELHVNEQIVRALETQEITEPTDIQQQAIPLIKAGKDVIGMSQTGSGKTAAFGIPVLERIVPGSGLQALIMAPTRELAVQISREMQKFAKYMHVSFATVYGGVGMQPQIDAMAKADVLVGTPGRLLDHLQRGNMNLSKVVIAVLDEADKMVDMGFIEDVEKILSQTAKDKQMLLFGATISTEIEDLQARHMKNPETVRAAKYVGDDCLKQFYYDVKQHEKFSLLIHLLKKEQTERVLIFCSARRTVEMVANNLRRQGVRCEMIHGKLNQNRRQSVMDGFNEGNPKVLVASAVAARGLDVKFVTHVFNYDVSNDPQEYVHRVGRTARAGESGKAFTLLGEKDHEAFGQVLRYFDVDIKLLPREDFAQLHFDAGKQRSGPMGSRFRSGPPASRFGNRDGFGGDRRYGGDRRQSRDSRKSYSDRRPSRFGSSDRQGGRFRSDSRSGGEHRQREISIPSTDDDTKIKNWRYA